MQGMSTATSNHHTGGGAVAARAAGLSLSLGPRPVLVEADLEVAAGESVAITGPSGSGKSSLLLCMMGLVRPDEGEVEVAGHRISSDRRSGAARMRREQIGAVFQDDSLLPELSPVENVALAGLLAGLSAVEARTRAEDMLGQLGVPVADRSVADFSGGERQRVAVARALVNEPALLLADEPTGSLDPTMRDQVCDLLFSVPERFGCGLVVVTHDPQVAGRADRWLALRQGRLVVAGEAAA